MKRGSGRATTTRAPWKRTVFVDGGMLFTDIRMRKISNKNIPSKLLKIELPTFSKTKPSKH
jgi:hypothetical protein